VLLAAVFEIRDPRLPPRVERCFDLIFVSQEPDQSLLTVADWRYPNLNFREGLL
jgi:hypothetical protein